MRKNQSFPVVDVAFEGFRLLAAHPVSALMWVMVLFAGDLALSGISIATGYEAQITRFSAIANPTTEEYVRFFSKTGLVWGLIFFTLFGLNAVVCASIVRLSLSGRRKQLGDLKFGPDELRFIAIFFILTLLMLAMGFVMLVVFSAVGVSSIQLTGFPAIGLAVFIFVSLLFLLWNFARLMLAYPIAIDEKKIAIAEAYIISRGRGLNIIFSFIILTVLYVIFASIVSVAIWGVVSVAGLKVESLFSPIGYQATSINNLLSLKNLASTMAANALTVLYFVLALGTITEAYRVLRNRGAEQVF